MNLVNRRIVPKFYLRLSKTYGCPAMNFVKKSFNILQNQSKKLDIKTCYTKFCQSSQSGNYLKLKFSCLHFEKINFFIDQPFKKICLILNGERVKCIGPKFSLVNQKLIRMSDRNKESTQKIKYFFFFKLV